jgi:hypothetical protein
LRKLELDCCEGISIWNSLLQFEYFGEVMINTYLEPFSNVEAEVARFCVLL